MRIDSVYGVKSSSVADIFEAGKRGELDYSAILKSKKEELKSKIENGDTEEKIPIGGSEFTIREWDKLMHTIDKAQDAIKDELEAREERLERERLKETLEE